MRSHDRRLGSNGTAAAKAEPVIPAGVAGQGLAGHWLGVLKPTPNLMLRLALEIKNPDPHQLDVVLVSIDQQGARMPASSLRESEGALQRVQCPVLALGGGLDLQVAAKENLAAIEAALIAGGNRHFTVKELPGLKPVFQTARTGAPFEYAGIEETMSPIALREISEWIHALGPKAAAVQK